MAIIYRFFDSGLRKEKLLILLIRIKHFWQYYICITEQLCSMGILCRSLQLWCYVTHYTSSCCLFHTLLGNILILLFEICCCELQGHTKSIHSVCWDPSGEFLASVSEDSVRVWTLGSGSEGECVHELSCNGNKFHSCVFHPTYSSLLVIGCYQASLHPFVFFLFSFWVCLDSQFFWYWFIGKTYNIGTTLILKPFLYKLCSEIHSIWLDFEWTWFDFSYNYLNGIFRQITCIYFWNINTNNTIPTTICSHWSFGIWPRTRRWLCLLMTVLLLRWPYQL